MTPEFDNTPMPQQPRPKDRGRVVAVRGSVVDVAFAEHDLPDIHEAVEIRWISPAVWSPRFSSISIPARCVP